MADNNVHQANFGQRLVQSGDDGGSGMNDRLTRLETHFEYIQRDLSEIRTGMTRLNDLPTKADLNTWKWQWVGTALALIAFTVGGIAGGLALINRTADSKEAQPIVIQIPAQAPAAKAR